MSVIYIHWPFCLSKCHYCDFNSFAFDSQKINFEEWLGFYKKNIEKFYNIFYSHEKITSIYFGGGTPSLLPEYFIAFILEFINKKFDVDFDAEITLEANPKTLSLEKAQGFRKAGVNRLSIGVQSLRDADLKVLGRIHSSDEALQTVSTMCEIFDNVSIDLIYNRPNQKIEDWQEELEKATKLPIQHMSVYELIIEDNTALKVMIEKGQISMPRNSSIFFENTMKIMKANNYNMYEVSNYAKIVDEKSKDFYCGKHNLSYWKYEDYYGVGPGAHSRIFKDNVKFAISQKSSTKEWITSVQNDFDFETEILTEDDIAKERLIMGLRAKIGINLYDFSDFLKNRYNFTNKIEKLLQNSYIMIDGSRLTLTSSGVMRLNLIIEYLMGS